MPKWPNPSIPLMIATHADSVVAEAINKGFHDSIISSLIKPSTRMP